MSRQNFWPLRSFTDLADVNAQARKWLDEVANQRQSSRNRPERPTNVFSPRLCGSLPLIAAGLSRHAPKLSCIKISGCLSTATAIVCRHAMSGRQLTVKADASSVTIYDQHQEIVRYARCWQRGQTFGAERFQKELFAQMAAAQRSAAQQRLVDLARAGHRKTICAAWPTRIALSPGKSANCSSLIREYGPDAVAAALGKAHAARAFGADYIANILRQQQSAARRAAAAAAERSRTERTRPPIRCRWPNTTLSSCVLERNPMTSLHQKLNQLSLTTMSQPTGPDS